MDQEILAILSAMDDETDVERIEIYVEGTNLVIRVKDWRYASTLIDAHRKGIKIERTIKIPLDNATLE